MGSEEKVSGWVYIVRSSPAGPLKVGMTYCVRERRKQLRCPEGKRVSLVMAFLHEDCGALEERAHYHLRHQALGREWFNASDEEAIAAVQQAKTDIIRGWTICGWPDDRSCTFHEEEAGIGMSTIQAKLGPRRVAKARMKLRQKRRAKKEKGNA